MTTVAVIAPWIPVAIAFAVAAKILIGEDWPARRHERPRPDAD